MKFTRKISKNIITILILICLELFMLIAERVNLAKALKLTNSNYGY
jgi:hypothetical protein